MRVLEWCACLPRLVFRLQSDYFLEQHVEVVHEGVPQLDVTCHGAVIQLLVHDGEDQMYPLRLRNLATGAGRATDGGQTVRNGAVRRSASAV